MNAKEAHDIAAVVEKAQLERRFNFIMRQIEAAVADGKYDCRYYEQLQDKLIERLQNLGYEVNKVTYIIGWRNV